MGTCYLAKKLQNVFKNASSLQKKSNTTDDDERKDRDQFHPHLSSPCWGLSFRSFLVCARAHVHTRVHTRL